MTHTPSFQKTARAMIAALVIGAASISAMPAQAAGGNVAFGFNFNSGNGVSFSVGADQQHHGKRMQHKRRHRSCMNDRQLRRGLRDYGFRAISFGGERRGKVRAEATRGRWEYSMRVDRCDGEVSRLTKVRRHRGVRHHNNRRRHGNGVQLQFNFR